MIDNLIRGSVFYCLSMIEDQYFVTERLYQCKVVADQDFRADCKSSGDCCTLTLSSTDLVWIAVCIFRIQTASFEKVFHTFSCFFAVYPHIPETFPNSVAQSTSRIKRFHWHLKNHLDILIGFP